MTGGLEATVVVDAPGFRLEAEVHAPAGAIVAVLGPNGAGKTTFIRALAGLVPLTEGTVELAGTVLDDPAAGAFVPPEERSVGAVFQDHLLFPHLTALDNVAFGLRARGRSRAEARAEAGRWLDDLGEHDRAGAKPRQLSGGQAQRVAIARALAIDPDLLLLDEPLSALDATARVGIRHLLRDRLAGFAGVTLLVTHDPVDALTLADRVVVLEGGRVAQAGPIAEVVARPRSRHVAELLGVNLLAGRADGATVVLRDGGTLTSADRAEGDVLVRFAPRAVALHARRPEGSARNVWRARVRSIDQLGDRARVLLDSPLSEPMPPVVAEVTLGSVVDLALAAGTELWVSVKATELDVYSA
jgi:molybdate transport system ATP-binding protein